MWIPSFFSFPFTLPSLPGISLPTNIQRRFLSYVLRRTLGRFVVPEGLDVERISAQVSEGWVELDSLELDPAAVSELLPDDLPLRFRKGVVEKVTANLPFPNLWSAPLAFTLDTLTLDLSLTGSGSGPPRSSPARSDVRSQTSLDLAESVTSAADDFLHQELDAYEEAHLESSIRQSLVLSATDPFATEDVPGSFPSPAPLGSASPGVAMHETESTTVLAGLIERILARLHVQVRNVKIRIHYEDDKHGAILELRIGDMRYADESASSDVQTDGVKETVRAIRASQVELHLLPPLSSDNQHNDTSSPGRRARHARVSVSSESSTSTSSSTLEDGDTHMDMMASAVADLRQSTVTSASGRSVYYSTMSDSTLSAVQEDRPSNPPERSSTPPSEANGVQSSDLLVSFGKDDVEFRIATERYMPRSPDDTAFTIPRPAAQQNSLDVSLTVGTISITLAPNHIATVIAMITSTNGYRTSHSPPADASETSRPSSTRIKAGLRIKAIYAVLVYDVPASTTDRLRQQVNDFHLQPTASDLTPGHVKFRARETSLEYEIASSAALHADPKARPRGDLRRASTGPAIVPLPHRSTSLVGAIQALSVYECLVSSFDGANAHLPILLFDASLPHQYGVSIMSSSANRNSTSASGSTTSFPSFDSLDWRDQVLQRRKAEEDQTWILSGKRPSALKHKHASLPAEAVVRLHYDLSEQPRGTIDIQPLHMFLDLSLVERLIPALRLISPAVQPTHVGESPLLAASRLTRRPSLSRTRLTSTQSVLDDLDTQASVATLQPDDSRRATTVVRCPIVRVDIRCPAPAKSSGGFGDGIKLRSGIITLDIHGITAEVGLGSPPPDAGRPTVFRRPSGRLPTKSVDDCSVVKWNRALLFLSRANDKTSTAFLVASPFATTQDEPTAEVVLPSVSLTKTSNPATFGKTSTVAVAVPCLHASITQSVLEGLQFFADDITQWLNGTFGDGKAPKPKDELKMIGSRFFGSKGSSSASDDELEEDYEAAKAATMFRLDITEADIALLVPRIRNSAADSKGDTDRLRRLACLAADVSLTAESNIAGRQETAFTLVMTELNFADRSSPGGPIRPILARTTPFSLTLRNEPFLQLRFSTSAHPMTAHITTEIRLALSNATLFVTQELGWIEEMKTFAKTPEGVFEDVTPSEVTNITVSLHDFSTHFTAPTSGGALVAVLGSASIDSSLVTGILEKSVTIDLAGMHLLAVDDASIGTVLPAGYAHSAEAWRKVGYAPIVEVVSAGISGSQVTGDEPEQHLEVEHAQVRVTVCADSLASLGPLFADLARLGGAVQAHDSETRSGGVYALDQSIDVFDSIEENIFDQPPSIGVGLDLIDDDLPTNHDYLDRTSRRAADSPTVDSATGEGLRSWQAGEGDSDAKLLSEMNGETIKMLYTDLFDADADYWDTLPVLDGTGSEHTFGITRVRVANTSVSVFLHGGYDWIKTRKAIEDEIKTIRRRLERIRQLLASGQQADESLEAERTSSVLFNSVYLGVDRREGMAAADLLAAIDEELDDLGDADETATQSSWQTQFPARHASAQAGSRKARHKGKKLSRSKHPQIELTLASVLADLDIYSTNQPTASRLHVAVGAMEILDHIKTSTWKKFLTEMKADSRGNMRETNAEMVRLEVSSVRPGLPASLEEEYRVKAKVLPLRLHVDQDALDFMKRFFAFKMPSTKPDAIAGPPAAQSAAAKKRGKEPYFQHIEIFPVELKLDYKPKRVDFTALREGRTIELMNFFHFDGAEMTLRHVTLTGITGVERLSTSLQDIWTPDVKANQLADVISGVSPIRTVVNVGSGVADLILLPIEQYRKDGRVSRGVQRGTNSFVRSTAMEMMKLGARLATGTQVILEKAEGVLGGKFQDKVIGEVEGTMGPDGAEAGDGGRAARSLASSSSSEELEQRRQEAVSRYSNQPQSAREGMVQGYTSLKGNMMSAAQTILAVPMEVYERSGDDGPLRAVVRAVPIAVLKPMIGASEAVSKTLLGMRNSLDPQGRLEQGDKYK